MPTTFATSSTTNDFVVDNFGNLKVIYDLNAVMTLCKATVEVRLGEMIFHTDQGIPFFETIFKGNPNVARYKSAIKQALLAIDGVTEITSINFSVENNKLLYIAIIITEYGTGQINGNL